MLSDMNSNNKNNHLPQIKLTSAEQRDSQLLRSPPLHQQSRYQDHPSAEQQAVSPLDRTGRSRTPSIRSITSTLSRSPIRPNNNHHYTTQRLRNPSLSSLSGSQRRSSLSSVGDQLDFSTGIGMPHSHQAFATSTATSGANSSTGSNSARTITSARIPSSKGSPRSSFNSSLDHAYASTNLSASRRHSDHLPRKPSTAEVFDIMEREQDAIVLKLMREIAQLKEDNRALINTINQLTNNSYPSVRSRNNSVAFDDYDMNNLQIQDHH